MKEINPNANIDCLGLGIIPLDMLFEVAEFPKPGTKIDGLSLTIQGGGPVPNTMIGLSKFGFSTSLIAAVGDDLFGTKGIDEVKQHNVDTTHIVIKKQNSAIASGFVEKGTGQRTLVLERKIFVEPEDIALDKLPIPKIVHLDGRDMKATIKLAKWGQEVGAIVSFDIGSIRNDVSSAFEFVDHLVVADSYALPFTNTDNAESAIEKLLEFGPSTVVVTEGINGSVVCEKGQIIRQSAYKVKTVDTTGAGDAFHTGYLYGLLSGFNLSERLNWGAAVAALKCTKPGARTGIPTLEETRKYLESDPERYA